MSEKIYFSWLVVISKMPFDDGYIYELVEQKLNSGRFKRVAFYEDEEKYILIVNGGTRRDFEDFTGKRIIEITHFECNLLLDMFENIKKGE